MSSYNAPGNVQYSYAQLEGIWCQAGGSPTAAPIAAAVAMAESGGNTTATNQDSNGTVDRGLWQINSVHGAQSTYDVMGNARAAVAISNNGQNWAPWTTYNNGAYRQFVQTNVAADMSAPINATNAAANATLAAAYPGGGLDPLNYIDPWGFFGKIFTLTPANTTDTINNAIGNALKGLIITMFNPLITIIAGVMGITAGGVMVLLGVFMIVKNTEAGQEAGRAAGMAAKLGVAAVAPEAAATTRYIGSEGGVTTVQQHRRAAGAVRIGGRRIQYRPGQVRTDVTRPPKTPKPERRSYQEVSRDEAGQYQRRGPIHPKEAA